jgi:DNA polymerase-3 subunit epsilon
MREIVLDTETTGLDPNGGDRVLEIGCVELLNHVPTGRTFHAYLNPERPVPADAIAVHGLTDAFLKDKPKFPAIAEAFLAFIGASPLVIHNAAFDVSFLNAELGRIGRATLPAERAIDTLRLARQAHPGAPASLDALCKRFQVDASGRAQHGALKDALLLAEVYLELKGGRQPGLRLVRIRAHDRVQTTRVHARRPRLIEPTDAEALAHRAFVATLKRPLWSELDACS